MEKNKEYSLKELCEMEYANNKLILPLGWINKKERVYMNFKSISGLFIGGATGTGKSIFIDDLILSLMYKNAEDDVKFVMLDPKRTELGEYNGIKYLITGKSKTSSLKGYDILLYVLKLLEARVETLNRTNHRTIDGYNRDIDDKWPHIFVFVDEGCDIIKTDGAFKIFEKILEFGKIVGIHLIYATNSYLKDYVKSNFLDKFKYRMTFDLASSEQEEFINIKGSNWLSKNGEALIKSPDGEIYKFWAPYVDDNEILNVVLNAQ